MTSFFRSGAHYFCLLLALGTGWLGTSAAAQQPDLNSHQVNSDRSVTFRYYSPTAKSVTLSLDYDHRAVAFQKGADGVWTYTTAPLAPAWHSYGLAVDGVSIYDPLNSEVDFSYSFRTNAVRISSPTPQLWDETAVPHGVVHQHRYPSAIIQGLSAGQEDYFVYTPPGYDAASQTRYPVLYLLHGWSANARSWLSQGQANYILDNLIAQRRIAPMIVVMPACYGDMSFALTGFQVWNDGAKIAHNLALFQDALLQEIIPQVETEYRVFADPAHRAIAGLSMGGGESLLIGLSHSDYFSWIGGFSSALLYPSFDGVLPALAASPAKTPKLLWISCGIEDDLIGPNRKFVAWIQAKGFRPRAIETPGIHNWPVWRDNLIHFAPLLFGGPSPQ